MSIRDKTYTDYGLSEEDAKRIVDYCRSDEFCQSEMLMQCALDCTDTDRQDKSFRECLAKCIYESIVSKKSYEYLYAKYYIAVAKNDFYGYRRKCIGIFYNKLPHIYGDYLEGERNE